MMRRLLSMVGGIAMGLTTSQFLEYAQQYEQRLGGAVDELRIIAEKFDADAQRAGLTRDEALRTYEDSGNAFLTDQGVGVEATLARYERLLAHLQNLENANLVTRVTGFAEYYDPEIGARALEAYNPAVPVTAEGFVYAGAGVVAGYGGVLGILSALIFPFRRRRSRVRINT